MKNQTMQEMSKDYIKKLNRKMKMFRDYPEAFEDLEFAHRYLAEGDRFATLADLYDRLVASARRLGRRAA